ncbi:MAG: ArsR/SmtB family transcription factor [Acidithiobacillus sp.]
MDTTEQRDRIVICLEALASPVRLDIFRLLVEQEPAGLVSGEIAEHLEQAHNGISFHLKSLQHAGLATVQRKPSPPTSPLPSAPVPPARPARRIWVRPSAPTGVWKTPPKLPAAKPRPLSTRDASMVLKNPISASTLPVQRSNYANPVF